MKLPVAIVAALLTAVSPVAAADWIRVETENFIVYGETGERRVREVALEFERFREALARVIPNAAPPAAVPTVVVVFGSSRAFESYKPRFNGKPVKDLEGVFFSSEDMNVVALVDSGTRADSLRTIFHEYVHLAISNMTASMPVWLNEGLAEYYSTFEVQDEGRRALLGRVIPAHLLLLSERRPLPIDDLLAVDHTSPVYNEGERRTLFYAQSWALVHMLVSGLDNRSSQLAAYVKLVSGGTPSRDAWRQVFGEEDLIKQLERYIGRSVMKGVLYTFDRDIPKAAAEASKVNASDAEAALADLLRRVAPREETSARFEKALALEPRSARVRALYGLHALDHGDEARSRALLMEAADDRTDWLVQYHVATGLAHLASFGNHEDATLLATARDAVGRVLAARPELANAHALSARLDSVNSGDLARGLEAIRRARTRAPGRTDYIVLEAFLLMRRSDFTAAKALLAPLMSPLHPANVRDVARQTMGQIAQLELDSAEYRARLEGRRFDRAAAAAAAGVPAGESRILPAYRKTLEGETRVEGHLERIECVRAGVVLHLRVDAGVEQFSAGDLSGIDFISYRGDLGRAITCAARTPPDRVYVTWRADGSARHAIAVEFLPK